MKSKVLIAVMAVLLGISLVVHAATARDRLYEQFGPKLMEAVCLVMKDEINVLRSQAGLSERTTEQMTGAIETKLATLADYDWPE